MASKRTSGLPRAKLAAGLLDAFDTPAPAKSSSTSSSLHLRDHMAITVMQQLLADYLPRHETEKRAREHLLMIAQVSYAMADEMIKVRNGQG